MSSSSFFNWISVRGHAIHESGPFGEQDLHSRDASANLEFTVGRPWGNTALLTGYSVRGICCYRPAIREYFSTSTYVGMQHKFGKRLTARPEHRLRECNTGQLAWPEERSTFDPSRRRPLSRFPNLCCIADHRFEVENIRGWLGRNSKSRTEYPVSKAVIAPWATDRELEVRGGVTRMQVLFAKGAAFMDAWPRTENPI